MSRICIKNVGTTTSERQLKELFGSRGEVTDVRIVRTKSGKSRQLAFVGFRTNVQAQDAIRYFNNTFIETSRVTVEEAKKVGDQELLENARSRHTKKKLEKLVKAQEKDKKDKKDKEKAASAPVAKAKAPPKDGRMSKEKRDFMEAMKPKRDKKFWANDESGPAIDAEGRIEAETDDIEREDDSEGADDSVVDDGDDDDDDDVNDLSAMSTKGSKQQQKQKQQQSAAAPPEKVKGDMTDMAYLRSKVRAHFSDDDDDGDSGDEDSKGADGSHANSMRGTGRGDDDDDDEEEEEEENIEDDADADNVESGQMVTGESKDGSDDPTTPGEDDDDDSGRLFVRNLIFSCSEDEIRALFETYGPLASVHLPLDNEKKGKGFGFVQFVIPEQARRARVELDGSSFQGRLLHVITAKKAPEVVPDETKRSQMQGRMSAYQLKREEERRAQAGSKDGWNASFVRSDAVVDALAERYGVARNEILDRTEGGGELAVRLAVGEAQVIQENRDFFAAHGVDLCALESSHAKDGNNGKKASSRSDTTMLIKNLPYDVVESELEVMFGRFGALASLLVPKSKSVALVDFVEPSEARAAFKGLAYRKYHHVPLYLEWAPLGTIDKEKAKAAAKLKPKEAPSSSSAKKEDDDDYSTLFVKNLKFSTDEDALRRHIEDLLGRGSGATSGLRTVTITRKQKDGVMLSMGFGFAEFRSAACAEAACKRLQGSLLESHALDVKPSDKRLSSTPGGSRNASASSSTGGGGKNKAAVTNKLIVRNLAFQATKSELKSLFAAFGAVKRVRIPKKMGGVHRGFAFIDFSTNQEAAAAMAALSSAHLYGRHLVLEYAKDDDEDMDVLRKRAKVDEGAIQLEKKRRLIGDVAGLEPGTGGVSSDDF